MKRLMPVAGDPLALCAFASRHVTLPWMRCAFLLR
jgi:hypothetical protein